MRAMSDMDGSLFGPGQPCFGCAPDHPIGFRLSFERGEGEVITRFVPHERYQGPPGILHGGLAFTLADEIGAWAIIVMLEKFGFTAQMQSKLHKPIRVGEEVIGRGRIAKDAGRVVDVVVTVEQGGAPALTSELRFVILDARGAERMLGGPLPESWRRFAR